MDTQNNLKHGLTTIISADVIFDENEEFVGFSRLELEHAVKKTMQGLNEDEPETKSTLDAIACLICQKLLSELMGFKIEANDLFEIAKSKLSEKP